MPPHTQIPPPLPPFFSVSLKAHVAQSEVEKGDLESERNQLQTLAMTLKEALEQTGNTKKVTALFASNKMLVRLWETL